MSYGDLVTPRRDHRIDSSCSVARQLHPAKTLFQLSQHDLRSRQSRSCGICHNSSKVRRRSFLRNCPGTNRKEQATETKHINTPHGDGRNSPMHKLSNIRHASAHDLRCRAQLLCAVDRPYDRGVRNDAVVVARILAVSGKSYPRGSGYQFCNSPANIRQLRSDFQTSASFAPRCDLLLLPFVLLVDRPASNAGWLKPWLRVYRQHW